MCIACGEDVAARREDNLQTRLQLRRRADNQARKIAHANPKPRNHSTQVKKPAPPPGINAPKSIPSADKPSPIAIAGTRNPQSKRTGSELVKELAYRTPLLKTTMPSANAAALTPIQTGQSTALSVGDQGHPFRNRRSTSTTTPIANKAAAPACTQRPCHLPRGTSEVDGGVDDDGSSFCMACGEDVAARREGNLQTRFAQRRLKRRAT